MATGTVKCFNAAKGFGFIAPDDGSVEVFVHYTAILSGSYWTLKQNQRVQFTPVRGEKGPQAESVQPL
jgi:CspA family cold shock protein